MASSVPVLGDKERRFSSDFLESIHGNYCMPRNMPSNDHLIPSFSNGGIECSFGTSVGGREMYSEVYTSRKGPKCLKDFENVERSGTEVSYRCMDCRNCKNCLKSALI